MSSKNFNSFKDFQSDQIQTSSRKLFTVHYACGNSDLNLTPVTGTTNAFIFQIINSLIESLGVRFTCFDCKNHFNDQFPVGLLAQFVRALQWFHKGQGSNPGKPEFFSGFLLATALVTSLTTMIFLAFIP